MRYTVSVLIIVVAEFSLDPDRAALYKIITEKLGLFSKCCAINKGSTVLLGGVFYSDGEMDASAAIRISLQIALLCKKADKIVLVHFFISFIIKFAPIGVPFRLHPQYIMYLIGCQQYPTALHTLSCKARHDRHSPQIIPSNKKWTLTLGLKKCIMDT